MGRRAIDTPRSLALLLSILVAVSLAVAGCSAKSSDSTGDSSVDADPVSDSAAAITVSAAGSLKAAFEDIAEAFTSETGIAISLNSAASGVLQKQIEQGAEVDVFASASPVQMDALVEGGFVSAEATRTFAGNEIVIVVPAGNPAGVSRPQDLLALELLTTGNPDTAPHGKRSFEVLDGLGLLQDLRLRFVFAENIAQTLDYVSRGEVDAGMGFASEAQGRDDLEIAWTAPADMHVEIRYVIAVPEASENRIEAERFVEFVLSKTGAEILARHGFLAGVR